MGLGQHREPPVKDYCSPGEGALLGDPLEHPLPHQHLPCAPQLHPLPATGLDTLPDLCVLSILSTHARRRTGADGNRGAWLTQAEFGLAGVGVSWSGALQLWGAMAMGPGLSQPSGTFGLEPSRDVLRASPPASAAGAGEGGQRQAAGMRPGLAPALAAGPHGCSWMAALSGCQPHPLPGLSLASPPPASPPSPAPPLWPLPALAAAEGSSGAQVKPASPPPRDTRGAPHSLALRARPSARPPHRAWEPRAGSGPCGAADPAGQRGPGHAAVLGRCCSRGGSRFIARGQVPAPLPVLVRAPCQHTGLGHGAGEAGMGWWGCGSCSRQSMEGGVQS